jgi:hypothetical protein
MGLGRNMRRISRKGEEQTARECGGHRQPASGALPAWKGDVKLSRFLVDRKDTSGKSFVLREESLRKLKLEAMSHDRDMVMQVVFVDGRSYGVIDWDLVMELDRLCR